MNQTMFFKKKVIIILLILEVVFLIGCQKQPRQVNTSFYHWKTDFHLTDFEKNYCKQLKINKLYVRIFDVDWDDANHFPKPIAIVDTLEKTDWEIIPTIFITNRTFTQLADNQIDTLVKLIFQTISLKIEGDAEGGNFNEIQIDCDWTNTTRERFFSFLKKLKTVSNKKISSTIRLHQVKFKEKTGVPPVDGGVLMAYNMGNLEDAKTQNSILDIEILKSYVSKLKNYPLKLDVALPIFSWGVVIRDGEVVKLINNLTKNELQYPPQYFIENTDNHFEVLKNTYLKGFYLYKDDEIRIENTDSGQVSILKNAADIISQNIDNQQLTIIFYHLDSVTLQRIRYEELENITHRFQ
jgi:hypothetical protein